MNNKDTKLNEEKYLIPLDEAWVVGTIAFGYRNKKEAISAMFQQTGEMPDVENMQKIRVMKYEKDGEPYYSWAGKCNCCGSKNNGVISWADLH